MNTTSTYQSQASDVTILGGGLAGLTMALQLKQELPNLQITVLEKRDHPVPEAAHKVGESTVEVGAHYFGKVLGLAEHIREEQLPKLGLRFFFPEGDNSRIENRRELGGRRYAPCPSYQLDRGRFENHLADLCLERGIDFRKKASIKEIEVGKSRKKHHVTFESDKGEEKIESKWLVDASGRRAFLKRQLGLQKDSPHIANAAWFRFSEHIKIDDWTDDPEWQEGHSGKLGRWYSTNHLMGKGYWVWLIPLSSGSTSMGIVAAEEFHSLSDFNSLDKAIAWLEKHEPQCAAAAKEKLDKVQDFRAIKHYATECEQVFSSDRWGITGEAGFFHDPFYSPGSDFIALSNTFITDLIKRDFTGGGIRIRSRVYDRIFKRFYYGTKKVYQDQYQMFGNPVVMPAKILWDYLVYWSITGFIFMHGRTCEQMMYLRTMSKLSRLGKLNEKMQELFRQWHQKTDGQPCELPIANISEIPLILESNTRLVQPLNRREYRKQFNNNLRQLEAIATEFVKHSGIDMELPCDYPKADVRFGSLDSLFEIEKKNRNQENQLEPAPVG